MKDLIMPCIANIIGSVVFGKRLDHEDAVLQRRIRHLSSAVDVPFTVLLFGAFLRKIPFLDLFKAKYWHSRFQTEFDCYQAEIEEHRKSLNPENIRDMIDAYLVELQSSGGTSLTAGRFESDAAKDGLLAQVVNDMFFAGTLTTSSTLQWAFLMMILHPQMQEKVREEIFEIVGHDRLASTKNRVNMPYTESTLMEVQRFCSLVTFGFNKAATGSVKLCGYDIPKGAAINTNIYAVHRDPANFPDPDSFIPDRFLDENGKVMKPSRAYMPFLIGKRMCLGESMARMELFLFFVSTLQKCRLSLPPGHDKPSTEGIHGIGVLEPPTFEIIATLV